MNPARKSGLGWRLAWLVATLTGTATPAFAACSLDDALYSRCTDSYALTTTQLAVFHVPGGEAVSTTSHGPGGEAQQQDSVYDPYYGLLYGRAQAVGPTASTATQAWSIGTASAQAQADVTAGTIRVASEVQPAGIGWDNSSFAMMGRQVSLTFSPTLAAPTVDFRLSVTGSSDLGGQPVNGLFYGNVLVYRPDDPVNGLQLFDKLAGDFYNGTREAHVSFNPLDVGKVDIDADGQYRVTVLLAASLQGYGLNVTTPYSFVGDAHVGLGVSDGVTLGYVDGATPWVTPVPEPATWASMLFGLAAVGAIARRRRS